MANKFKVSFNDYEKLMEKALNKIAELQTDLRHTVFCMDRSCKRCNELALKLGFVAAKPSQPEGMERSK